MVETFRQREVQTSGQVPGYQNVTYSPDAYGAQVGRALTQLGQTGQQLAQNQFKLDSEKKANDALDYRNKASDELRPVLFDADYGVYAQSGGNAMGGSATAAAAMENIKQKYLKSITDPETARAFEKLWLREEEQTKDKVALHEMNQLGNYKVNTAKATLTGSMTDAYNQYNDPKAVELAINKSLEAIRVNADGLPPEALALAEKEARSQVQLAVISRYAGDDPDAALDYYTSHKSELSGKDHVTATALVDAAASRRRGEISIQRITGQGGAAAQQLFRAQIAAESDGDPNAESPKGASGLMQVMPDTARELLIQRGQADLAALPDAQLKEVLKKDEGLNIALGSTYMNQQLARYDGDIEAALVAYNAGPGWADKFLEHNAGVPPGQRSYDIPGNKKLKTETEGYVNKVMTRAPGGGGMSTPPGYRLTRQNWDLKNFAPEDIIAPTEGGAWVDARAARGLDTLADVMGQRFPGLRISINERGNTGSTAGKRRGTSDPKDNPHVKNSQHIHGTAFDVQTQSWSDEQKEAFVTEARKLGFKGFGFYGAAGHLHIDMGKERTWGPVPDWAKGALATPAAPGPIPGAQQFPGSSTGSTTDDLPPTSAFSGPGTYTSQGAFASTKAPDLQSWLLQAEQIADPREREYVKAGLRIQAAEQENALKAEKAAIQQSAWDIVLQGSVKDLGPEILSRLEPSFVNTLSTYEANRVSSAPMPMDWKAWTEVPTDPKELAKIQPYDWRNKLDDEHFDKLVNMQREAIAKEQGKQHDGALLANMRTTAQISSDMVNAQGWDPKTQSGASAIAEFNKQLDFRIAGEQAVKGEKLSAVEIQDIADKLLIEDKVTTLGFSSGQGQALAAEDPSTFQAAGEWEEVAPDDQSTVIETYARMYGGEAPDQEKATDLYNRAMRVWLGAKPEGPDDEEAQVRTALEAKLSRPLSDSEFEKYYGRYLLKFLGR